MERLDYSFFRGKNGAEGFVKRMGEDAAVHCGGLKSGERYALRHLTRGDTLAAGEADGSGHLTFSGKYPGALFLSKADQVILWEGGEKEYWRACAGLREMSAPKEPAKTAEPACVSQEEATDAPAVNGEANEPSAPATAWRLRAQGDGVPVDALPRLRWPQGTEKIRRWREAYPLIRMFGEPGWRFMRVPSPIRGAAYCAVGYYVEGDAVTQTAWAVPGSPLHPPVLLPGYRWHKSGAGMGYWVLWQRLTE